MHELSVTQSVVDAVVEKIGEATVVRLRLEVGRLSGVVVDSVRFCFDLVAEGTTLEGATLEVDEPVGRARCRDCRSEFDVTDLLALCQCGGIDLEIVSGQDLRIKEVEVA
jgi:hydrogenase nickel incorporation protein HypA/HybF